MSLCDPIDNFDLDELWEMIKCLFPASSKKSNALYYLL
jgi:hypothetical protein